MDNKLIKMRDTCVEVDLDKLIYNYNTAKSLVTGKTFIAAVLKANAYGHGAIHVAEALIENGVELLAVACLSEALELRKKFGGISIMIMGYTPSEYLYTAVSKNIIITIFSLEQADKLSEIALSLNTRAKVHIKIDTGFNRIGLKPCIDTLDILSRIVKLKNLDVQGIFTHLALRDQENDLLQVDLFMNLIKKLEQIGINIPIKHICDSIGMVRYPEYQLDMVRVGAFLYGVRPSGFNDTSIELKMPLTFKTRISQIKEVQKGESVGYDFSFVAKEKCMIGTLPVGYADGYMRCLSNKAEVIVRGKRALVIGKLCMDQCMIDLTNIPEAEPGDDVVLLGGDEYNNISIMELADNAGTNRNEILSIISRRVPRIYIKNKKVVAVVDYLLD